MDKKFFGFSVSPSTVLSRTVRRGTEVVKPVPAFCAHVFALVDDGGEWVCERTVAKFFTPSSAEARDLAAPTMEYLVGRGWRRVE